MSKKKQVIGGPLEIGGRVLSLSRAIRAGDFVYLTGQIPMKDGAPMTEGTIEDQTRAVLDDIKATLAMAGCGLSDVVKAMVWLRDRTGWIGVERASKLRMRECRPEMGNRFPHRIVQEHTTARDSPVQLSGNVAGLSLHPVGIVLPSLK